MKLIQKILVPQDSANDDEVKIVLVPWIDGAFVEVGDTVLEYETSKAINTLEFERSGYVAYLCTEGKNVAIGAAVALIFDEWDEKNAVSLIDQALLQITKDRLMTTVGEPLERTTFTARTNPTLFSAHAETLLQRYGLERRLFAEHDFVTTQQIEHFLKLSSLSSHSIERSNVRSVASRSERVVVICANQIAADVIDDILGDQQKQCIVGYVVDDIYKSDTSLPYLDCNVLDFPQKVDRSIYDAVIMANGGSMRSMRFRKLVFALYRQAGVNFTNVISPSANIASRVSIGVGNIIEGNVYIGTGTQVGDNNFISYGTVIGHHNRVGDCNLFAPGVMMAGRVSVGDDCIFMTGVNFMDQITIGDRVVLPPGYNVIKNLKDDTQVPMAPKSPSN
jgi:acetyltransferase-like isoleucine patch superfamily enzyme